jgi:hypothetical protein
LVVEELVSERKKKKRKKKLEIIILKIIKKYLNKKKAKTCHPILYTPMPTTVRRTQGSSCRYECLRSSLYAT